MNFAVRVLFVLITTSVGFAQSPSKILQQAETALGGSKVLKAVRSVTKTGTISRVSDGVEGKYLSQTSAPNLYNLSFDINVNQIVKSYGYRKFETEVKDATVNEMKKP